jgi:hypothetical protein
MFLRVVVLYFYDDFQKKKNNNDIGITEYNNKIKI